MKNPMIPKIAYVKSVEDEGANIKRLTLSLKGEKMSSRPGQFVEVTVFGYGEFPVSISDAPSPDTLEITVRMIGRATSRLSSVKPGDVLGVRGPFGNGFPIDEMKGKDLLIVTGGVGLAPVKYLLNYIINSDRSLFGKITLLHGARTPHHLIYREFLLELINKSNELNLETHIAVEEPDEDWNQHMGLVTELLEEIKARAQNTVAIVCGPLPMMKLTTEKLLQMGFSDDQILLSMERKMQCGIGLCGHCTIGFRKVCLDGPIFKYKALKESIEDPFYIAAEG